MISKKPHKIATIVILIIFLLFSAAMVSCSSKTSKEVVVYVSVDQVFSEPVLKDFESKTSIKVLPVYDVEATKTTGLVNRLLAEKKYPKADVFWNGEFVQTILLKENGVLEQYKASSSADIPENYIDPENYWTGFGGRARVLLVNKNLMKSGDYPSSLEDLLDPGYPAEKTGIANPVFGTAATHAAAIYAQLGGEKGCDYFEKLKERGVQVVDGNSVVRDMVVNGQLAMGLTDTDDAGAAIKSGRSVDMIFLDQQEDEMGTLVIPNTVAKIKNCKNPDEAEKFIDYLLSADTENALAKAGWFDFTLRGNDSDNLQVKGMNLNLNDIYSQLAISKKDMTEIFIR